MRQLLFFFILILTACNTETITLPITDSNPWQTLSPGLEKRTYNDIGQLTVLRIDPALYRFQVHYRPGDPLNVIGWRDDLPEAVAFINTNFFDPENRIVGLLVADGIVHGSAYQDRGGMFTVQNDMVRVRSNTLEPYAGETLQHAVQAFPMLVVDGTQAYTSTAFDRVTRRTAIGQDAEGRILLMVTSAATLLDLSAYLTNADLGLVNAFNLDGGGSSMMYTADFTFFSFDAVPAVLAVYPR